MKTHSGFPTARGSRQDGQAIIIVAGILMIMLAISALALDIGYLMVGRAELQNVADASALAAARRLGSIYEGLTLQAQQTYVCDPAALIQTARDIALRNKAAGSPITIVDADVTVGDWDTELHQLTPGLSRPNAVRVVARRDTSANSPVSTFFAKAFGIDGVDVTAQATAALTALSTIEPDELIPVGLSQQWFDSNPQFCGQPIKFYPTYADEGCAGWNTYERWPASESYLRKYILEDWVYSEFTPPAAETGDEFVFIGGALGDQTYTAFLNLFNYMKTRDDDGDPNTWTASVVVYKSAACSNPTGRIEIVGFAMATITAVLTPPAKEIRAIVACNYVQPGRSGGGNYGTMGSIPGLVQ